MSAPQASGSQALDKLKAILLTPEKERIAYLEGEMQALFDQLNDKEKLIDSLDPIIADLLYKKILGSKSQMAEALAPVMGGAIKKQIAEAKDDMADALYPVIGQAVRKSVAEAMKNLMQAINDRIDNFLNQGFRAGKEFDRYLLLKQSLPFYVEEIFLIHKETGLLLAHASQNDDNNINEDMVSGMLTAIRQFSNAAFSANEQSLHEIDYEQFKIIMEDGKYAYLAFVVKGAVSESFKTIIQDLENKIHLRFYKEMRAFNGKMKSLAAVKPILSGFIASVNEPLFREAIEQNKTNKPKGVFYLAIIIFLLLSIFFIYPTDDNLDEKYNTVIESFQKKQGSFFSSNRSGKDVVLGGALFEADRTNLLHGLKELGFTVSSDKLFVLPNVEALQASLTAVQKKLNLVNPLTIVVDSAQIILQGQVPSRQEGIMATRLFAAKTSLPLIINDLDNEASKLVFIKDDIEKRSIYFAPGTSTLSKESVRALDSILAVLQNILYDKIIVTGFADPPGPEESNRMIAKNRAEAVKNYLLKNDIPLQKIETAFKVVKDTKVPDGFKSNRRASFKVD